MPSWDLQFYGVLPDPPFYHQQVTDALAEAHRRNVVVPGCARPAANAGCTSHAGTCTIIWLPMLAFFDAVYQQSSTIQGFS